MDSTGPSPAANTATPSPIFGLSMRAVIRHDREGKVLLLRRPESSKHFPGLWEFPGGKTDAGESFDKAMKREIQEETGIDAVLERVVGQAQGDVNGKRIVYVFMEAHAAGGGPVAPVVTLSRENTAHRWVTLDSLVELATAKETATDTMVPHFRAFAVEYARQRGFTTAKPAQAKVTAISPEFVTEQVQEYGKVRPHYEELSNRIHRVLRDFLNGICPLGRVEFRVKEVPSFAGKILRKGHYADPLKEMTDLCGVRVITQIGRETEAVCRFIREHFIIDERNSADKATLLRTGEFGYRSVHFVVQLDKRKFPDASEELLPLKAEIQVRTLLQHAWADIGHDRLYKGEFKTPPRYERESARIAALLEDADAAFQRLVDGLEDYECHYGAYLTAAQMEQRTAIQRAILEHDADNKSERLRLVRLLMAQEKWQEASQEVRALPEDKRTADLWSCLGDALRHQHDISGARDSYANAVTLDPSHREARVGMAETATSDEDKFRLYQHAYQLHGDDPATLSGYVRQKIKIENRTDFVPLLRPNFEAAIERCLLQVEVGVDLPWSYFRIAGFRLLLDGSDAWDAYDALARAVRCSDKVCTLMETACEAAAELVEAEPHHAHAEAVRRMLLAALWAKFEKSPMVGQARALATAGAAPISGPVVIVAGGCDPAYAMKVEGYQKLIHDSFEHFSGTVLSGGTLQGIAGMVGALGAQAPGRIRTLGYLPESLPPTASEDCRYHELRRTKGTTDFSVLEPVQNWLDLLASGIKPHDVRVLGINGGRIAAFEYRLAWALGARVALIQDTGREADKLDAGIQAGDYPGMMTLPDDAMTVQAFLHGEAPWPASLPAGAEERLARYSHASFLEHNRHKHSDPAMHPWETLRDDLRGSNQNQITFMIGNLRRHGFEVVESPPGSPLYEFTGEDKDAFESMAKCEHGRWNVERLREGWRFGPKRDPENKRSPYLVSWDKLDEGTRQWDRDVVQKYPATLAEAGLGVVRCSTMALG